MSNIQSAQAAIQAELSQAKAGMAHYQSRIEALEKALTQLANVDGTTDTSAKPVKDVKTPKAKAIADKPAKSKKVKTSKASGAAGELPSTGGDFWPSLITAEPKHGAEVLQAAISQFEFTPTAKQVKMLQQRQTFALNSLVKAGKIQDSGSGRSRVFFKA